jgi:hypothetical protein
MTPVGDSAADGPSTPGTFTVALAAANSLVRPGATATVGVTVARNAVPGAIAVTVAGLPANVTASALSIGAPPAAQTGQITLTATATAQIGATAAATVSAMAGTIEAVPQTLQVTVAGASGSVDPMFAAVLPYGSGLGTINNAILQPDGKVLLFGTFHQVTGDAPAVVIRMNADGSRDASFISGVMTSASASPLATGITGLVQPSNGNVVVAWTEGANSYLNVTRVQPNGALDFTWHDANKATVSTTSTFASMPPAAVPLALTTGDGSVVYAQTDSSGGTQIWRWTNAGQPDTSLGIMGDYGTATLTGVEPEIQQISDLVAVLPQAGGTYYFMGSGAGGGSGFFGQVLARTTAAFVLDSTFGVGSSGWEWQRGSAPVNASIQVGADIFSAVYANTACGGTPPPVTYCVTKWTTGATDVSGSEIACPANTTGLTCGDQATVLTAGPNQTVIAGGSGPVAVRFTTGPLAIDSSFGSAGVSNLQGTSAPLAILSTPDGFTLLFSQDATKPIQRLFP